MNKKWFLGLIVWSIIPISLGLLLWNLDGRSWFIQTTRNFAILMGFIKLTMLGSSGEILSGSVKDWKWRLKGAYIIPKAFVWGFFGIAFTFIFPLVDGGVDFLIAKNKLSAILPPALWKSLFINVFTLFAPGFMVIHRITDAFIERKILVSKQWFSLSTILEIWNSITWNTVFKYTFPSILWFWVPYHYFTFSLPAEFQVVSAAYGAIFLGFFLPFFSKKKKKG